MSTDMAADESLAKVFFELEVDEDGYPPAAVESLWAERIDELSFRLRNVPFFVRGYALYDVVACELIDGNPFVRRVLERSGHSTIRIHFSDASVTQSLLRWLEARGCGWEQDDIPSLYAVDLPSEADYRVIRPYLIELEESGAIAFEEGCLAHAY